jgi:hypothetical protein
VEVLPDRINPDGSVAIFDDADPGANGSAGSPEFGGAANDYDHHYGAHSWDNIIAALECHVTEHGTIDTLYIFDHGQPGAQSFGDEWLTPAHFAQLAPLLSHDAVIILGGCQVANGAAGVQYLDDVAQAAGVEQVVGSTTDVLFSTGERDGHDFRADEGGNWVGSNHCVPPPDDLKVKGGTVDHTDLPALLEEEAGVSPIDFNSVWVGPSVAPPPPAVTGESNPGRDRFAVLVL